MDELDLLPAPWRETFELMWEAYVAGTIPVGAVVAGDDDVVVSRGRNRIFGDRVAAHLGGTRLAHAEINALVGLSSDAVYEGLTLYTALEPSTCASLLQRQLAWGVSRMPAPTGMAARSACSCQARTCSRIRSWSKGLAPG